MVHRTTKKLINYNMRCIETMRTLIINAENDSINYNMRCIETKIIERNNLKEYDKLQHEMY